MIMVFITLPPLLFIVSKWSNACLEITGLLIIHLVVLSFIASKWSTIA